MGGTKTEISKEGWITNESIRYGIQKRNLDWGVKGTDWSYRRKVILYISSL